MAPLLAGYDFWKDVLKSPKYVAAPMVDMSELGFRMLCRHYGANLCFSPMLHSQQYIQDVLYRSDNFSTCPEDNPLIIQFCSNDPNDFVNAASFVASKCCAVDLNLGCPQAIAKKGHYGAFLQDDWDLVHSIVRKASSDLPVPVTCKMRILAGNHRKSVEYARMLEQSGCSVLTVHGRTRDQKGHATGLASWDAIKTIKESISIPMIANGNILTLSDVQDCLELTGADAVMSAEALLNNPALFSGKNPTVWTAIEEYLQYAEKYNTPLKIVRCHLFKMLYLCIYLDKNVQEKIAAAKTYADFYAVCELLQSIPQRYSSETTAGHLTSIENDCDILHEFDNTYGLEISRPNAIVIEMSEKSKLGYHKGENLLPIWLCHSRPRIVDEYNCLKSCRGSFRKYFEPVLETRDVSEDSLTMSKKKMRKLRRYERIVAAKKEKRKVQRMRKKIKQAELMNPHSTKEDHKDSNFGGVKRTKKEQKMLIQQRLLKAQGSAPKVCIDLGFVAGMDRKDLIRLSCQLRRLYGSNRHSNCPLHLFFVNFSTSDDFYQICLAKNDGFSSYVVEMHEESPEEMFDQGKLIYLSPDSENVLENLNQDHVYVIGGIVDANVKKGLTLDYARQHKIQTARLPIVKYLAKNSTNPGSTVLTVNQVFDILLKFYETNDWIQALSQNVPMRKGYSIMDFETCE